jgi:hypothetical protein
MPVRTPQSSVRRRRSPRASKMGGLSNHVHNVPPYSGQPSTPFRTTLRLTHSGGNAVGCDPNTHAPMLLQGLPPLRAHTCLWIWGPERHRPGPNFRCVVYGRAQTFAPSLVGGEAGADALFQGELCGGGRVHCSAPSSQSYPCHVRYRVDLICSVLSPAQAPLCNGNPSSYVVSSKCFFVDTTYDA